MLATFCKVFGSGHLQETDKYLQSFDGFNTQICFMFKLHGCWLLYIGTALARNLGDCQIFDMYSNNILDLLGLTNLGTKCEDVVCKYEQVRELRFETAISCCILHFATCIFQNLPVAKTDFSKRIHKVELQS